MAKLFIRSLYNVALFLLLLLGSPLWLLRCIVSQRFRAGLSQRFLGPSAAFSRNLPALPRIWIHAVSVGEVLAVSSLVRALEEAAPQYSIVVSTTTRTGQALAHDRFGSSRCFYFPLDFPWSVRTALRHVQPSILVLAESELWPNVLSICGRAHVPVIVVNARVSDRSLPRYCRLRFLWYPFLQMLSCVLAQTEEDARRLQQIGIPAGRISVSGNLKFDVRASSSSPVAAMLTSHLLPDTSLLVCGSTLDGEEALLLEAWPAVLAVHPAAVMVLAPRHPERFDAVANLLAKSAFPCVRRSVWMANPTALPAGSVFLLDSIGELAALYAAANVAFIGGSLVPAAGHNPLEPAQFGVPIAMGTHYENFREIVELLIARSAINILQPQSLARELVAMLSAGSKAASAGLRAKQVFEEQAGATSRTVDAILALLAERGNA